MRARRLFLALTASGLVSLVLTASIGTMASAQGGPSVRHVQILDACDPTTFNAAFGPGTCTRNGGVTLDHFISQLEKHGRAAAWRFSPSKLELASGGTILAKNRGGEEHTFTEVAAYGGGCVPPLNAILGLTPVPECSIPGFFPSELIAQGDTRAVTGLAAGVHRFQCLIHPWQNTTVSAR
jgi:plastocyanin